MTTLSEDLKAYNPSILRRDLTAGITVGLFAVPQAMAYAQLADIEPIYGIYSAIVIAIVGSLFNSCKQLIHGPTNAICIMIADVQLMHVMDRYGIAPSEFMAVVLLLTFMVGVVQLGGAIFRFGEVARFISPSVVVGFTVGAAILIMVRQFPKVLGLDVPADLGSPTLLGWAVPEGLTTIGIMAYTLQHLSEFEGRTLAVGAACAVFILVYRRVRPYLLVKLEAAGEGWHWIWRVLRRAPGALFAIVAAAIFVAIAGWEESGVRLVAIGSGRLPPLSAPLMSADLIRDLLPSALAIAVIGMIETLGIGKTISARTREPFDPNRQLWSEAISNMVGAFFSSFAGSSSFTRSALNVEVGGATRFSGVFSGIVAALLLVLLSPLLAFIPLAALSGVLIAIGFTLIETHKIAAAFRASRDEAIIVSATALWAVVFGLEGAILIGVGLSVLFYLPRAAILNVSRFIRDERGIVREKSDDESACSKLEIVDIEGALFFGAVASFSKALEELSARDVPYKIVRIHNAHHIEQPICEELVQFIDREREKGVTPMLCGIRTRHREMLARTGVLERLGPEHAFFEGNVARTSTVQVVAATYLLIGPHDCPLCASEPPADMEPFAYTI